MATSSDKLEDHISCSICFEIYRDPHALPCLHTFCLQCIKKIHEDQTIQCPECREFTTLKAVKRDFKTQALLDFHKRSSRSDLDFDDAALSTTTNVVYENILEMNRELPSQCEMCEKTNALASKCKECDQFMCSGCDSVHQTIKTCKTHQVTPVTHFIQTLQSDLKQKVSQLETEQTNLKKSYSTIDKSLGTVDGMSREQCDVVDRNIDRLIKDAKEHRVKLHTLIKETNSDLKQKLSMKNQMFKLNVKEMQAKIDHLKECFKSDNLPDLMNTVRSTEEHINRDIEKLQREIKNSSIIVKSPMKFTIGSKVNMQAVIAVKVYDINKVIYSDISDRKYSVAATEPLSCSNPRRIRLINDEIWCAGYDGIYMYNSECQFVGKIKHEKLKNVYSVAQTQSGHIIAACLSNGLHMIDSKGTYVDQIARGKFSDVCYFNNTVYTLDVDACKVLLFRYGNTSESAKGTLMEVDEFSISHGKCSHDSRISVNQHGISISSYNSQSLFLYSQDGNFKYQITSSEKLKLTPLMCDTDSEGNVLIANHQNHKLLVYKADRVWEELILPEVSYPIDILVDTCNLWAVNYRQKVLFKFTYK